MLRVGKAPGERPFLTSSGKLASTDISVLASRGQTLASSRAGEGVDVDELLPIWIEEGQSQVDAALVGDEMNEVPGGKGQLVEVMLGLGELSFFRCRVEVRRCCTRFRQG